MTGFSLTNSSIIENVGNMNTEIQNALFASWLAGEVNKLLEESSVNQPWRETDKRKFPRKAFLWVDNEDKRSSWHIPYRQGTGEIDKRTGYYESAGAVNLNVLRAVAQVIERKPDGQRMIIPAKIRSKINNVLEVNKIGRFSTGEGDVELHESSIAAQFVGAPLDKENHVVKNVAVLSPTSSNRLPQNRSAKGRSYSQKARESVARLVEGAKAYTDHESKEKMRERGGVRSVRDFFGYYGPGTIDEKGVVRADFHYLSNHAEWFEPLVEQASDKIGNSIHASGEVVFNRSELMENVTDIHLLSSIDLVTETGSTKNLFESMEGNQLDYNEISMKDLTESRPDLIAEITKRVTESLNGDSKVNALEAQVTSLTEANKSLKTKQDESDLKEKLADKKTEIDKALKESKLKDDHISETFRTQLEEAEGEGSVKALIEDREKLVLAGKGVTKMGKTATGTELEESEMSDEFDEITGTTEND